MATTHNIHPESGGFHLPPARLCFSRGRRLVFPPQGSASPEVADWSATSVEAEPCGGKMNIWNRVLGFVHIKAKLGQENLLRMVRWLRWHCPPDTGFEIRALAVWGRARYLSVTEAPRNTYFHTWMGMFLSNRRDWEPNPELWRERQRC